MVLRSYHVLGVQHVPVIGCGSGVGLAVIQGFGEGLREESGFIDE